MESSNALRASRHTEDSSNLLQSCYPMPTPKKCLERAWRRFLRSFLAADSSTKHSLRIASEADAWNIVAIATMPHRSAAHGDAHRGFHPSYRLNAQRKPRLRTARACRFPGSAPQDHPGALSRVLLPPASL
jgi:hypothetical protein